MPNDPKTTAYFTKARRPNRKLKRSEVDGDFATARAGLKRIILEATDQRFDLAEIADEADRNGGVEEMNQKIGALLREVPRAIDALDKVAKILDEIERETPRIAGQLGVDLT